MELWIARDLDGSLALFETCPVRRDGYFEEDVFDAQHTRFDLIENEDAFKEVTWENSPQKVELKLK